MWKGESHGRHPVSKATAIAKICRNGRQQFQLVLAGAVLGALSIFVLLRTRQDSAWKKEQREAQVCQNNQENLRDFAEIAYNKLGLPLILVEPKLLELLWSLETTRDEHVRNRTLQFGHPEVAVQDGEKVLTWSHHEAGSDKVVKSIVDYSLPLTVFGYSELICKQWRTSFALFYKDGLALKNGTVIPKLSWQLADLADEMKAAGFSVALFEGEDPRLTNAAVGINMHSADPLLHHIRFFRGKHNIYITVMYERVEKDHYWHSALTTNNGSKSPVHFGAHAGSWKRFKSRQVQLDFGLNMLVPEDVAQFLYDFEGSRYIECNMARAAHFFKAHPPPDQASADEAAFVANASRVMQLGRSALDELKIPFWISSGTCLGWFRQCSTIPHSKDVDFGIFTRDHSEHIVMHMLMRGFKLKHRFGTVNDSLELSFTLDDVKLDFFFFYDEDTHMWNGGTQARTGKKFKYFFPKFSLCWTEFAGLRVRVPCQTQSYIEANYGLTWDEPVKEWNWKASPPNVRPNGKWDESEWSKVIQVY
eukprot:scpid12337/ scgid13139/ Fukutin